MKRLLLPFLISFCCLYFSEKLKAQPTLTAANSGLQIGDEYVVMYCYAASSFVNWPQIGPSRIWDFSQYSTIVSDTIRILDAAQVPFSVGIPNANLVISANNHNNNNEANYRYLKTDSLKIVELASWLTYMPGSSPTVYAKPADMLIYPFSMGSTHLDTTTNYYIGQFNDSCSLKTLYTIDAVGYGQLITPVATYNQTLLVRTVREFLRDSCQPQIARGYATTTTYDWYVPGIHLPVVKLMQYVSDGSIIPSGYYLYSTTLRIKEELATQLNLQTFPNPATSEVTVQFQLKTPSETQLVLTDALGKVVLQKQEKMLASGSYSRAMDVSKLPKGMYLVRLETADNVAVKKLLVQ